MRGRLHEAIPFDALPYHLWANRAPSSMQAWVAEVEA
jgi:hypothetical protein